MFTAYESPVYLFTVWRKVGGGAGGKNQHPLHSLPFLISPDMPVCVPPHPPLSSFCLNYHHLHIILVVLFFGVMI